LQQFTQHHAERCLIWRAANDDSGVATANLDLAVINSGA
jgi:hypothetical protein